MNPRVISNQIILLELEVVYYISERTIIQFIVMMRAHPGIIHDISNPKPLPG